MDAAAIIATLQPLVPGASYEVGQSVDSPTIYLPAERLVETCLALRDAASLRFNVLVEVTAADYLPREPRYEVVYHLLSTSNRLRLRLKVRVGAAGSVPTVQTVWRGAAWPEREVWDMFGIVFDGHPDLRRLLMPEDWDGHPQRKDYPVQIRKVAQTYEPLEVSEAEFKANIERDRVKRTH
ncbi:MAG TPA: NADH-quinone oxidoreductase subunit C [Vicinamibacterales bacterium]|jgi:NADH-quinone oxidoreductase subunit C|nr:NADH-quinone oxidoreductase subunit C [Vicinamibacterales bacterium]